VTAAVDQAPPASDQAADYTHDQAVAQASAGPAYTPVAATVQAVTIPEAASALRVSIETIRRRLRKKQLAGQKLPTAQGFEWRVLLPVQVIDVPEASASNPGEAAPTHAPGAPPRHTPGDGPGRELARLEAHVADLRTELAGARAELEARRREVQQLHVIIARLTPAPAPLPAPEADDQGDRADDQAAPTRVTSPDAYAASESPTRPSWWRRAWTLITGA
jgi:hypothetical protein